VAGIDGVELPAARPSPLQAKLQLPFEECGLPSGVPGGRVPRRVPQARLVRVRLKQPTEDGGAEADILTNLPARVKAVKVAWLYLSGWKVEGTFHELTVALNRELNTPGYPDQHGQDQKGAAPPADQAENNMYQG
jgi:hypothetical protein